MKQSKTFKTIVYLTLGLTAIIFLTTKIHEDDIWFHLTVGKYILKNFSIPYHDLFSYTAANPYIDSHWLYQIILYIFYGAAGFFGIFLYQFLIIGAILYILHNSGRKSNFYISTFCIFLTLIISNQRFMMRPEMFSYLFAVLFVLILENRKKLYLLPVIQILWTNMHGFFVFGPLIIGCYFLGELIQTKFKTKFFAEHVFTQSEGLIMTMKVGLLCILACFINPYGYKLAFYPFLIAGEVGGNASPYFKSVSELAPTFLTGIGSYYKSAFTILIIISFASFFIGKKFSVARFFVNILFLYVSFIAVRNTAFFAFVAALITIINFKEIKKIRLPVDEKTQNLLKYSYVILIIILSAGVSAGIITNKYYRHEKSIQQFGIGKIDILYPTEAINFIKNKNLRGNIFNDAIPGGYFLWNCWPERKVFADGRLEVYGEKFLAEYKSVIDNPDIYWQKVADKYKIDYVLLQSLSPHSKNLIKHLYKNNLWELAYFDEGGIVFVKSNLKKIKPIINELNPDRYSGYDKPLALISYANFFFYTDKFEKARLLYIEVLESEPDFIEAYINLGAVLTAQKKYQDAANYYRMSIKKSPKYAEPFLGLAVIYLNQENYSAAFESLVFALRLKPIYPEAQFLLSYLYQKSGQFENAISVYKEMISRNPSDEKLYDSLGTAYYLKGDYQEALSQFKKALEINPQYNAAKHHFDVCSDKIMEIESKK